MEEGRRRRQLYDERKWAAQSELRRVLAERAAVREKEGMLRLLLQVCFFLIVSPCCVSCWGLAPSLCALVPTEIVRALIMLRPTCSAAGVVPLAIHCLYCVRRGEVVRRTRKARPSCCMCMTKARL